MRIGGGRRLCGGQGKEWMGCFLDDLRAFGINAEQRTTAAQDEEEWRRMAEQGVECFVAKWVAGEKVRAELRYAVVCPNVTRMAKERIAQSKQARAGSLAVVDYPQVARNCILRAFLFTGAMPPLSGATFIFRCFVLFRF